VLKIKRVYERPEPSDGYRILVDRLWPRGLSKKTAHIDLWLKEIAPSDELRKWFGHDPAKWNAFRRRYFRELWKCPPPVFTILDHLHRGDVTLVYGAKDTEHNQAAALYQFILELLSELKNRRRNIRRSVKRNRHALHAV